MGRGDDEMLAGTLAGAILEACTRPINLLVPALIVVAALTIHALWLLPVAAVSYVALAAVTVRDEWRPRALDAGTGAQRPLTAPVARRLEAGLAAADAICAAAADAGMPLDDVTGDVADLRTAMLSLADRADRVHRYLAANDQSAVEARLAGLDRDDDTANMRLGEALDAQVRALARLRTQLDRLLAEMDHLVAALQAMHAEVIGLAAIPDAWRGRELSSRVSELQAQVGALGEGLEEAYAETRSSVERRR